MPLSAQSEEALSHLGGPTAIFAAASAHPRRVAWTLLAGMALLAWTYLTLLAAAAGVGGTFSALGRGMGGLDGLLALTGAEAFAFRLIAANEWLSRLAAICAARDVDWSAATIMTHATMWMAMAVAMMLPTAAPMLRTYAEIADTAAGRGKQVVSPLVLAAGYITVWFAFAIVAAYVQLGLTSVGAMSSAGLMVSLVLSAAILAGAGIYQFTGSKAACLVKCANPFPFLFANWTLRVGGVFRLGLRQGLVCLACCWGLMAAMFAVGTMNIVWIALLTVVMTVEKLVGRRWFSAVIGTVLLVWAAYIVAAGPVGVV